MLGGGGGGGGVLCDIPRQKKNLMRIAIEGPDLVLSILMKSLTFLQANQIVDCIAVS